MMLKKWMTPALFSGMMLFLVAGCGSAPEKSDSDEVRFRKIASYLEEGGSTYLIAGSRYVLEAADQVGVQLFNSYIRTEEPPGNFREVMDRSMQAALLYRLSGIEDIEGIGASSVRISGKNESLLFRNRAFLMVKPGSTGVLWKLSGEKNDTLTDTWSELPAAVDSASEIDLRPGELFRFLKTAPQFGDLISGAAGKLLFEGDVEEFFAGVAGPFRTASIQAEKESKEALSGSHMMFSMPDAGGKIFGKFSGIVSILPGASKADNRLVLPPVLGKQAPEARPVFRFADDRIIFYSSLTAEKVFTAPGERLSDSAQFRELLKGLPEEGIGFLYTRESYARFFNQVMEEFDVNFKVDPGLWTPLQFAVLQREPEGFLLTGKSSLDWNMNMALHQFIVPAGIGALLFAEYMGDGEVEERPDTTAECSVNLEKFRDALKAYAAKHEGKFPAEEGIEGIRALLKEGVLPLDATICPGAADEDSPARNAELFHYDNCSYVYFAGLDTQSNPKLPLVVDWPYNHEGSVNVLYVDGTVGQIELEAANCKRIVSTLQTIHHYNEKDFRLLIQQADKLDKLFGLN